MQNSDRYTGEKDRATSTATTRQARKIEREVGGEGGGWIDLQGEGKRECGRNKFSGEECTRERARTRESAREEARKRASE